MAFSICPRINIYKHVTSCGCFSKAWTFLKHVSLSLLWLHHHHHPCLGSWAVGMDPAATSSTYRQTPDLEDMLYAECGSHTSRWQAPIGVVPAEGVPATPKVLGNIALAGKYLCSMSPEFWRPLSTELRLRYGFVRDLPDRCHPTKDQALPSLSPFLPLSSPPPARPPTLSFPSSLSLSLPLPLLLCCVCVSV